MRRFNRKELFVDGKVLTNGMIEDFERWLRLDERSEGTVRKYLRDVRAFGAWAAGREVSKELSIEWKSFLRQRGYASVTINSMLSALNSLFRFLGWSEFRVSFLRIQRRIFRDERRELRRGDYERLLATARRSGRKRLELIMETICSTGIRVGELRFITVESLQRGRVEVVLKGKVRTIIIPRRLSEKLLAFAKESKISSGEVFVTKGGRGISRGQVWAEMKSLCRSADVDPRKVFPHNLRHLFATVFYESCKDIVKLADLLGHSSVETTRIYLTASGTDHRRQLESLHLVY